MDEATIASLKQKSYRGVLALTSRTFLLQLVAFVSTAVLGALLSADEFGIFYLVSSVIGFLGYFADIGLAAALIQKKEELTQEDLSTTFTIQQMMVITASLTLLFFSKSIVEFYRLDVNGLYLLYALLFSFVLSSLKTIPSILLERNLEFSKLIMPQLLETVIFYGTAVYFAWSGYGVMSFVYAVVARAIVGLIAIYIVSPWNMKVGISKPIAKRLLTYGIPVQFNGLLALVKDDLMTLFLGKMLPLAAIGYIGWAKKWSEVPIRLIMDSVMRVTFPAFSRIQESKELLGKALTKTLFGIALLMTPITVGLIAFIQPLIHIIPKYEKWEPALVPFYLFSLTSLISGFTTPMTNMLSAIGQIKITLRLMVIWTSLTWFGTVITLYFFGYLGFPITLLLVSLSIIYVIGIVKKYSELQFITTIKWPLLAGVIQGLISVLLIRSIENSVVNVMSVGALSAILYVAIVWKLEKGRILSFFSIARGL